MPVKLKSELESQAAQIKNENRPNANSASRIGQMLLDIIDSLFSYSGDKSTLLTTEKTDLVRAINELKGQMDAAYEPVIYTADIAGAVTIDLAQGDVFVLTLTGAVTAFDFTGEVPGKTYGFYFLQSAPYGFAWAAGRYRFSFGNAPQLTDPTQNGSDPVAAVDIITALCPFAGRLDLVSSPNYVAN